MLQRKLILIASGLIGVLGLMGAGLFALGGAGIDGSPFQGDAYANITLALVLLLGPCAILPCTLYEIRRPQWGGILLCSLALIVVLMIAANHQREWGFAIHQAALVSLCLALPMFLIGSLLFFSSQPLRMGLHGLWYIELVLAVLIAGYFGWQAGSDGVDAMLQRFRGGPH